MNNYYILHLKEDMDLSELKFLLFVNNYKSLNAFYYNKPILVDRVNKTFTNVEQNNLETLKNMLKKENKTFKEFTFLEYKNYLKNKDKGLEK